VKGSLIATRASCVPFISLLLFGTVLWNFPELAAAQSFVRDDVKREPWTARQAEYPGVLDSTGR